MAIEIPLTRGLVTIIDEEDYDFVASRRWHAYCPKPGRYYAAAAGLKEDGRISGNKILLHRVLLLGVHAKGREVQVDHRDGDPLNNRRFNLRIASSGQNNRNAPTRVDNRLGLKGVRRIPSGRYMARIVMPGEKRVYLGCFDTPEEAHAAYCAAALKYYGEFARFA